MPAKIHGRSLTHHARHLWRALSHSAFLVGLGSLLWLVFRTGTKPSRAAYPCQRAAAASASAWLVAYVAPLAAAAGLRARLRPRWRWALVGTLVLAVAFAATWTASRFLGNSPREPLPVSALVPLTLSDQRATDGPASDLFVVSGATGDACGVQELIQLMGRKGLPFYQSAEAGETQGPAGLIGEDDVVLIKINCQWNERGGTNTDLLRSLIQAILAHPDGFQGEVVVADNGQDQYGPFGEGGSFSYTANNAEDHTQSVQKVVDSFTGAGRVSTYLWDTITGKKVGEYDAADMTDGYVVFEAKSPTTGAFVAYPKFQTGFWTYVSFKNGVWDPATGTYGRDRLKVVNVPVLKSHGLYGVTASVKAYMGVTSDRLTIVAGARAHSTIATGGLATEMVETRLPTLNLLDAIWVNAIRLRGPSTSYQEATRTNVIAASTDPVALDAWAARHILIPTGKAIGYPKTITMAPDAQDPAQAQFANYLRPSMEELLRGGYAVTSDEARMNVYVSDLGATSQP